MFVRSVIQVVLGRPRDLSCSCDLSYKIAEVRGRDGTGREGRGVEWRGGEGEGRCGGGGGEVWGRGGVGEGSEGRGVRGGEGREPERSRVTSWYIINQV